MENYDKAIQEAMRFAATPQGQQLIHSLQEHTSDAFRQELQQAGNDPKKAKQLAQQLLEDPQMRELLRKLGR